METKAFVGIDISKDTFDAAFESTSEHAVFPNNTRGYKLFGKWLSRCKQSPFVVMEHTGIYSHQLEQYLHASAIPFCKVAAVEIKKSMGLVRGKSDRADSLMIAKYGSRMRGELVARKPEQATIVRLKNLISLRDKMVADRAGYIGRLKEQQACLGLGAGDTLVRLQKGTINDFAKRIAAIEKEIALTIDADEAARINYGLLISIKGVGKVLASYMIAFTENFTSFDTPRQFACYSGIAPFPDESGKVKKRTRVSQYAYKKLKSLLHLAAMTSVRYSPEMKAYYVRRTEAGKNKMSTLNVIRNKIVARMFAVVKRKSAYETEWLEAA